ncbi:MAG TPA: ABC transporter permease [Ktedonobacterales bacterium]|nr:ABC transporter permease [Ktedonobacterales bacterium]
MKTDETFESGSPTQERLDALGAGTDMGVAPILPGEATQTPTTQRELDELYARQESLTGEASVSPFQASLRRFRRDKRALVSVVVIALIILIAYVGPFIYMHIGPTITDGGATGAEVVGPSYYHDFTKPSILIADAPSSATFPLGTDEIGRDILARIMAGVTVSINVAIIVIAFDVVLGLVVGTLAGYYGGWIDTFLARFTDLVFAFPALLFAILAAATFGQEFITRFGFSGRLIVVSLALAITIWPQMARYVRGQTLQLKEQQFVEAARTVGTSDFGIIMRHIVPNLFNIVLTAATLDIVGVIIGEATLSLLGLGVADPGSSLGLMIFQGANRIDIQPTEVVWPTILLAIIVICFSFIGDGIGDAFNPRSKD